MGSQREARKRGETIDFFLRFNGGNRENKKAIVTLCIILREKKNIEAGANKVFKSKSFGKR